MKKLFILSLLLSCLITFATNTSISDNSEVHYEHCMTSTFYTAEMVEVISMYNDRVTYEVHLIENSCTTCIALNGATRSNC